MLFYLCLLLWMIVPAGAFATRVLPVQASEVVVYVQPLVAGTTYVFDTTDLQGGADTHLVLFWRSAGSTTWTYLANNNDFGGTLRSSITYTAVVSAEHLVLMFSATGGPLGTADLRVNSVVVGNNVPVGGTVYSATLFTRTSGDEVHVVPSPDGSVYPISLGFLNNWSVAPRIGLGGGAAGATRRSVSTSHDRYLFGTPRWINIGTTTTARAGIARAYFNDANDTDSDDVGNLLEAALGLCNGTNVCPSSVNAQDSDRDGLTDYEEVFGYAGDPVSIHDDLAFPRYGADPAQKDVFVEVDWLTDTLPNNPVGSPLLDTSLTSPATWANTVIAPYLVGPSHHLKNPNGQNGVRIHFDVGFTPAPGTTEALIADHAIPDDPRGADDAVSPGVVLTCVGSSITGNFAVFVRNHTATSTPAFEQWTGDSFSLTNATGTQCIDAFVLAAANAAAAQPNHSQADYTFDVVEYSRHSVDGNMQVRFGPDAGQNAPEWAIGASPSNVVMWTRETGDQIRNRASRAPFMFFRGERLGRYRYGLITGAGGGGQASGDRFAVGSNPEDFAHELGHSLGLSHWGHTAWYSNSMSGSISDAEMNCQPHYYSLMNYAHIRTQGTPGYRFEQNEGWVTMNPASTRDRWDIAHPAVPAANLGIFSAAPWLLATNTGGTWGAVDFNLDGTANSSSSLAYRVPLRTGQNTSCGTFDVRSTDLSVASTIGAVDLVRSGEYLYAFYTVMTGSSQGRAVGDVRYRRATLGTGVADHSCTGVGADNPLLSPCLTWTSEVSLGLTSATGVSAVAWETSGEPHLFVAVGIALSSDPTDNYVRVRSYTRQSSGALTQITSHSSVAWTSVSQPEMGVFVADPIYAPFTARVGVVMNRSDNRYHSLLYTHGSGWLADLELDLLRTGVPIEGNGPPTLFTWPRPYASGATADTRTCALLPAASGAMRIFCLNPMIRRFTDVTATAFAGAPLSNSTSNTCSNSRRGPVGGPGSLCTWLTLAPVAVVHRPRRQASGTADGLHAGNVILGYVENDPTLGLLPRVLWSNEIDTSAPPWQSGLSLNDAWRWYLRNQWSVVQTNEGAPITNVALYDDPTTGGTFGLYARRSGANPQLRFLPFADGAFDLSLRVGSDFRVMEDYACWFLKESLGSGQGNANCGILDVLN